jgi:hypothetical protein
MWWERWIPKSYLSKSTSVGVECLYTEAGVCYYFTILFQKKNKIEILEQGITESSAEILSVSKKHNAPIILSIVGKGIIFKAIELGENPDIPITKLLQQYLPAVQPADFYIQFYKNQNQSGHLCICRKDQVNELIHLFTDHKQKPVSVYIGPLAINALAPLTKQLNFIYSNQYCFELSEGYTQHIKLLESFDQPVNKIEDLEIVSKQVISFASAFTYLTRQIIHTSDDVELNELYTKHTHKLKLNFLLVSMVVFLFVISGINSILFFQKFEEQQQLAVELNLYESKNAQITQLLESYQKKKTLIEQAGIFENKKIALFADKIAGSLPNEIVLRELNFNPEIEEIETDSLIGFKKNQLIIKGNCDKSFILNEWINVLKSQSFIKSVNLENFIFNSEAHVPNFTLEIEIN